MKKDLYRRGVKYRRPGFSPTFKVRPDIPLETENESEPRIIEGQFPKDAVKGMARDLADIFSAYLESPWEFWVFCFLTCLGILIADVVSVDSSIKVQARLFTILLGRSARTHKSTAIDMVVEIFRELFPVEFSVCRGVGSAEGLAKFLVKKKKTLLVLDEFRALASKGSIRGSVLLPCVKQLFDKNDYENYTKNSETIVETGYLSMLAASTVETFSTLWTLASLDLEFLNRLFLIPGETTRTQAIPRPIPEEKLNPIKEKLKLLVERVTKERPKLRVTEIADKTFRDWYENRSDSTFVDRLDVYGHRLMLLFCINEGKDRVEQEMVERVIQILDWQLKVRQEYQPLDAELKIAKVEQAIRRAITNAPLSEHDLKRKVHYERYGLSLWNLAESNLKKAGEIYCAKNKWWLSNTDLDD